MGASAVLMLVYFNRLMSTRDCFCFLNIAMHHSHRFRLLSLFRCPSVAARHSVRRCWRCGAVSTTFCVEHALSSTAPSTETVSSL